MTFREEAIADFKQIFADSRDKIISMPGCIYVELLQEEKYPTVMFTLSIWENEDALNHYRSTDYFGQVWKKTKSLFSDKPEAWSMSPQSHEGKWQQ